MSSTPITVRQAIAALSVCPDLDAPLLTEDGRPVYQLLHETIGLSKTNKAMFVMADLNKD